MRSTYIIAEAGVNHNGSLEMAKELIDAASRAGANAVKFQTFKAEKLVSRHSPKADYQIKSGVTESQLSMLKKLELDEAAHVELIDYCNRRGIEFLSTPFDDDSLEALAGRFGLPRLKIPSGEITNAPFLLQFAQTGKPVIVSTGMSNLGEVELALGVLAFGYLNKDEAPSIQGFQEAYASVEGQLLLKKNVTLLHCTTEYPAAYEDVNLAAMHTMEVAFGLPVGYSDHTEGIAVPIAAVARGASVIEKHFTLDRNLPGPDHKASLEPEELQLMVASIRQIDKAIGTGVKSATAAELVNKDVVRRSIVAAKSIGQGEVYSPDNLACKRPSNGLSPIYFWELLGKPANKNYDKDEIITL